MRATTANLARWRTLRAKRGRALLLSLDGGDVAKGVSADGPNRLIAKGMLICLSAFTFGMYVCAAVCVVMRIAHRPTLVHMSTWASARTSRPRHKDMRVLVLCECTVLRESGAAFRVYGRGRGWMWARYGEARRTRTHIVYAVLHVRGCTVYAFVYVRLTYAYVFTHSLTGAKQPSGAA